MRIGKQVNVEKIEQNRTSDKAQQPQSSARKTTSAGKRVSTEQTQSKARSKRPGSAVATQDTFVGRVAKLFTWANVATAAVLGLAPRGANAQVFGACPPTTSLIRLDPYQVFTIRISEPRDPYSTARMRAMYQAVRAGGAGSIGFCTPPVFVGQNLVYNSYATDMWYCKRK